MLLSESGTLIHFADHLQALSALPAETPDLILAMESEPFGGKGVSLPERLAEDHIRTWSNEGNFVLAPFDKDGAVAKIAPLLERRWLSVQDTADRCRLRQCEIRLIPNRISGITGL